MIVLRLCLGLFYLTVVACQQVIDVACPYMFKKTLYQLPSKTIHITDGEVTADFNLCEKVANTKCSSQTQACVLKNNGKVINAGDGFEVRLEQGDKGTRLISVNGDKCGNGTYTLTIYFTTFAKSRPMISDEEPCELSVVIPDPKMTPECTGRDGGYLIDVRPLKAQNALILYRNTTKIVLGFCKAVDECNEAGISGCEIAPTNAIRKISTTSSQRAAYDARKALVSIRSSYKPSKQKNRVVQTEVYLKCNWDVEMENPKVLLKRDHFEVESKHGCVKLPQICKYEDLQNFVYDLNGLNNPNGWTVSNTTKKLLVNVCGQLKLTSQNECSGKLSQVCHVNGNRFNSYGGIQLPITQLEDENLIIEYLYGSKCFDGNKTALSHTKITFVCNKIENGPVLAKDEPCSLDIVWKTPRACPLYVKDAYNFTVSNLRTAIAQRARVSSCKFIQDGVLYNLAPLMLAQKNYVVRDNNNYEYHITVCQPLAITNQTYMCGNARACVQNNSEPSIKKKYISFNVASTNEVFNSDGLSLPYTGGIGRGCGGNLREMWLHFRCAATNDPPKFLNKTDNCKYEFVWNTKHACPKKAPKSRSAKPCMLQDLNRIQNFTFPDGGAEFLLTRKNTTYHFSLCHGNYTVNNTNAESLENHTANMILLDENCEYFVQYQLSSELECYPDSFNTMRVYLDCDTGNDTYIATKDEKCTVSMRYKSQRFCNAQNNDILQVCKQNLTDSHVKPLPRVEPPKEYIPKKEPFLLPLTQPYTKVPRNCSINANEHLYMLNDMKQIQIETKHNKYLVGYNASRTDCDGFICKNGRAIGSLLDVCPNNEVYIIDSIVKVHFTGDKCGNEIFVTTVLFTCGSETENIVDESQCKISIHIPNSEICNKLQLYRKPEESHTALIVGVTIFSILLALIIIWFVVRKCILLISPYGLIGGFSSKSNTHIYTRSMVD